MRRHAATIMAALLVLGVVGPVSAGDPRSTPATAASSLQVAPSVDPRTTSGPASKPVSTATDATGGNPATDPAGRWIVIYKQGTNVAATSARQASRAGFTTDRTFSHAASGFSAKLNARQVATLRKDPSVAAVVPDERIELAGQAYPTGINRIGARASAAAKIDGVDERVDADVAIVDTGIAKVSDLNVVGGYNCSTSNHGLWRDVEGHGTHVAGTVGAIDNGSGVVGVAPGVRLWAVKILDDSGEGLLSWYVCGLDWIAAQRDPSDSNRPRFEAVNMSVAKYGRDDLACGSENADILHAAICRLVASGVTVVAAAANDSGSASARVPAAYNEVITVSALADTDGKPGGLGGHRCYSWGSYDVDDTFANFSNYGSDIDLIAPGKCIWSTVPGGYQYMSGTSMAAPHVTGAAALLKATRPQLTPAEVKEALQYLGTLDWRTSTDPDPTHEKLLDVSKLGPRGDFSMTVGGPVTLSEAGGTATIPVSIVRSPTSFERIVLKTQDMPLGFRATFAPATTYGFAGTSTTMSVTVPFGTPEGTYAVTGVGNEHSILRSAIATVVISGDAPTAVPPRTDGLPRGIIGTTSIPARITWPAATDPSTAITAYQVQGSADGGAWGTTTSFGATARSTAATQTLGHSYQYRVRARDSVGNWSSWAAGAAAASRLVQDGSSSITYKGTWKRSTYANASGGATHYATAVGASARTTFSGRAIALVAPIGPTRGSAKIWVDGVYRGTVSFRNSTGRSRVIMYSTAFPSVALHTIELRLSGNGRVDVDAFVIFR
ncbi:MAG TPA: S8 family serine peptidase [Candidatus Limnocylindrales bacterium]|jgi:subtilisin family serine protease|nr:S8 family serine peptidase [Candidatus Limnocylindrales bacterium]